jgi:hypothetical protein
MTVIKLKTYILREDGGAWLGQIVITSDGMFSAVTDYGNFAFAWRSLSDDFRAFMAQIEVSYFSRKMHLANSDIWGGARSKTEKSCDRFAEMILPPLQKILRQEVEEKLDW